MKVGLVDVDSKIPNLALMKLSAYHKAKRDQVKLYEPIFDKDDTDLVYASKIFKFSPDFQYWPGCKIIRAGSGYDLEARLPDEIENQYPDYSLYGVDYAMGFTSRGCIRNCGFCIVPQKEGRFKPVADIHEFWQGQKELMLLDNNLTSEHEHFERIVKQLIKHKIKTDFSQGLDIRLIDDAKARLLSKVRLRKQIHFAFDDVTLEQEVRRGIEILLKHMPASRLMLYVLIGWNSDEVEDLYRLDILRTYRIDPFVMPYDKNDPYQADLARYANHKATFWSTPWHEYKRRNA